MVFPDDGGDAAEVVKTCPAAMGFAFAAGTTDGPGAFDFKQGDSKVNGSSVSLIHFCGILQSFLINIVFFFLILILFQGNAFWSFVRNLLKTPNKSQIDCHLPKPILLDTGEMNDPYDWAVSSNPN